MDAWYAINVTVCGHDLPQQDFLGWVAIKQATLVNENTMCACMCVHIRGELHGLILDSVFC